MTKQGSNLCARVEELEEEVGRQCQRRIIHGNKFRDDDKEHKKDDDDDELMMMMMVMMMMMMPQFMCSRGQI